MITLLHCRVQIRYAASDIKIFASLVAPAFTMGSSRGFSCSWFVGLGVVLTSRSPMPSIVPMVIGGHSLSLCGHMSWAADHIFVPVLASHLVRMCSRVLFSLQIVQHPLLLRFLMLNQYFPILCVLWKDLYRKSWIFCLISCCLVLSQMAPSVSGVLLDCCMSVQILSSLQLVIFLGAGLSVSLIPL